MEKNIPVLYKEKSECCGCGACLNICPRNAISMVEDECGFLYPEIDDNVCIRCKKCTLVCAFQNINENNKPLKTYAAVSKNKEQAVKSASGGVFAAIAKDFLNKGGIVFGAAFNEKKEVLHKSINKIEELYLLQGSKYVQSKIGNTYKEVKDLLIDGNKVLFSGTPCQVAGLKSYLGKEYDGLLTVDIICHGVPSEKIFQSYLQFMEDKYGGGLTYFTFRDKNIGWGINGKAIFEDKTGKKKKVTLWQSGSSYLFYFIKGWIYRENCYHCKYAGRHRPGDITLGDYWGIEKQHPDFLTDGWDESKGISVVIANTEKGQAALERLQEIEFKQSTFEKAAAGNGQLNHPSKEGKRNEILNLYQNGGWNALEQRYQKKIGLRKYSSQIKAVIPKKIKRWLKAKI